MTVGFFYWFHRMFGLKTAAPPKTESLVEYTSSRGASLKVDRERGIIHGVKILGLESANGRTYRPATLQKAKGLYEGAKVNVDHPTGKASDPRSYLDRLGHLESVEQRTDGLYGDLHFNPKHAVAEQLCWDAEHAPQRLGMSHNVQAKTSRDRAGKVFVEDIASVISVDLVADPATTSGLFEGEGYMDPANGGTPGDAAPEDAVSAAFKAAVNKVLDDSSLDLPGKLSKIKAILKSQEQAESAINGDGGKSEEAPAEDAPKTEGKVDPAADAAALQEQVKRLQAELEARVMLESAGIKCGAATLKAFAGLTSEDDRKAFIAEHKSQPAASSAKPKSTDQWAGNQSHEVTEAKNGKEFAELLRRGSRPVFGRSA